MSKISFHCLHCRQSLEVEQEGAGMILDCPTCEEAIEVPYKSEVHVENPSPLGRPSATIKKKRKTSFGGLILELIGIVICLSYFPFGLIFGIPVMLAGSSMSRRYVCSACGNTVEDRGVRMCPHCRSTFFR